MARLLPQWETTEKVSASQLPQWLETTDQNTWQSRHSIKYQAPSSSLPSAKHKQYQSPGADGSFTQTGGGKREDTRQVKSTKPNRFLINTF